MIYEIAKFTDPDHTMVQGTDANGKTETTMFDTPAPFRQPEDGIAGFLARGGVVEPYAEPEPGPYRLYKSVFIRRMTETEAGVMEDVLAKADAKLRLMFNSVEYFVSDDPLFVTLLSAVGIALSQVRASELLAEV